MRFVFKKICDVEESQDLNNFFKKIKRISNIILLLQLYVLALIIKSHLGISSEPSRGEEMDLSRRRAIDFPYLLDLRKTPVASIICPPTDTRNYSSSQKSS